MFRSIWVLIAVTAMVFSVTAAIIALGRTSGFAGSLHGDVDCNGSVNSVDALRILRQVAGLQSLPAGCEEPPTPTPSVGLSRNNPVPRGQSLVVPEGWEITVTGFDPDATEEVLAENQFNDPPAPGKKFFMVRVRMKNVAANDPDDPDAGFALRMVGSENLVYTTFGQSCGVIPDDIDNQPSEVFRGGSVEGNVCYEVGQNESNFVILTNFFLSDDSNRRYFEVD